MGTINKVNRRTKVKALAQTPLQGWTQQGDSFSFKDLDIEDSMSLEYHEGNETFYIDFSTDAVQHCCGVLEFGNLDISNDFPLKPFEELFSNLINKNKGQTFIINTNGRDDSKTFETLLSKTNLFTPVKKFKNGGSGNIITIWISNGSAL